VDTVAITGKSLWSASSLGNSLAEMVAVPDGISAPVLMLMINVPSDLSDKSSFTCAPVEVAVVGSQINRLDNHMS